MKLQERKKVTKATLILNIMAIVMMIFAIFNVYMSQKYISSLIKQGFDPIKEIAQVINYYANAVTPYVFYAICLAALSYIIKKVVCLGDIEIINKVDEEHLEKASVVEDEDDEIDMMLKDLDVE
ncbi:MAG: hypothetical protein ACRDA5_12895 [Clostridium sp.]